MKARARRPSIRRCKILHKREDGTQLMRALLTGSKKLVMIKEGNEADREASVLNPLRGQSGIIELLERWPGGFAMEYAIHGEIHNIAPMKVPMILSLMKQVCLGLDALLQTCGLYHMDVSSENILFIPPQTFKLCDFEAANAKAVLRGKIGCMAPELFGLKPTDSLDAAKIDMWALGIVGLDMVFGEVMLTTHDAWKKNLIGIFQRVPQGPLQELLRGLLEPNPNQRWSRQQTLTFLDSVDKG